jgi:putative ABC transport system permease protein
MSNGRLFGFALLFLNWFCPAHLHEEIEGDLIQKFNRDVKTVGEKKAKWRLMWNVIRFFRFEILIRNRKPILFASLHIFSNYAKTAYRSALKNRLNFGLRLGGLTLALFSFLVIAIYVSFQLSFDKFHRDYQNIYRVNSIRIENDNEIKCASVPSALGAALKAEFPEVKSYAIVSHWGTALMRCNNKLFRSDSFIEAESPVFDVFTFEFISGDKAALTRPDGMVISETLAKQLFGDQEPLHKLISFPDRFDRVLEVRAVIKDLPPNSSIDAKAIVPFGALRDKGDTEFYSWSLGYGGNLFVRLLDHADPTALEEKIKPLLAKNLSNSVDKLEKGFKAFLQPLAGIYMGKPMKWEFDRKGNAVYLYVYISLAVFLLVISGINYLNLSIVDFSFRNKEIGVRKVLGAKKTQIVFQITIETIFHCLMALLVSGSALYILSPHLSLVSSFKLKFSDLFHEEVIVWTVATISILIILSAAYPAYCLSVNNPIHDLKRKQLVGGKLSVNRVLLLAQFAISVFCVSATWVVGNQLNYIQTKDIGFNRENLLEIFMPDRYPLEKALVLKQEISRIAGVQSASFSYYHITGVPYFNARYKVESGNEMKQVMLNELFVDEDFISTMELTIVEGRNFRNKSEFKSAFIINESAAIEFGWTNPIGKRIAVGHDKEDGGIWSEGNVVGVVKDFNTRSLHNKVEPLVMRMQYDEWPGYCLNVRYNGLERDVLAPIKEVYEKVLSGFLVEYERVNERYENQYVAENQAYATLRMATWVILLISCIGIFSMSLFISTKRKKEFGIRKVVGASIAQIAILHINYFLKVGLVANVVALPIAFYLLQQWLNGFAYKTEISSLHLVSFGVFLLVLVTLASGYSALKSGATNPVDVIKTE